VEEARQRLHALAHAAAKAAAVKEREQSRKRERSREQARESYQRKKVEAAASAPMGTLCAMLLCLCPFKMSEHARKGQCHTL
jgi:3-polyprenyl-4-hydroxybenzoate decarboxylase